MTARKATPAGPDSAEAKAAAEAEAKAAEEAEAAAAEAEAKAAAEAEAKAAAEAAAQAEQDDVTEDEYASLLASLSLRTAVHVQVDDRYQAFPAGTKVGDVVNGVEFSAELAETVTNPKAWVIPTQAD